ncbi:Glycine-tRNA ligase, beta subunit [Syntrophomonas zehnderi OL-4]|uniref:Glycine--tRNA ligase beta subunit n=1 Tax=Syntrophomonas zehnderi OL-4 TaxID=690567 RepID=A0A0E4GBV2_9FIRM|nr:glycine--tRNA ligase subunit beta [Syntrophomonas zehnderi]CFY00471.1 Glycine-tRNA ligase, beta subunit [Syntrophomonas zehnderi OL-4]
MSRDLLLEIGVEEMPSAFMSKALDDFKKLAEQKLTENRINYSAVYTLGTPRRLVLNIKGLKEKQPDTTVENRGPKKTSAFDKDNKPTKAALGFARAQGIEVDDLQIQAVDGVEYVFAVKKVVGVSSEAILPEILLDIIHSLSFPKSMRWGYYQTRFARPIRWLLALYGKDIISIQVENVKSDRITYGHRFLAPEAITVNSVADYFKLLKKQYVIVDQNERSSIIWQQVQEVAQQAGGIAMENEELLEEVSFLIEYPSAFRGSFSESYLNIPPEVLTTSMIEHQRYFPVFDENKQLLPFFIGVRNGNKDSLDIVRAGNERVLKARLEDALFFWEEDTKNPLADMTTGLANVMFHEKLGSVADKVERLKKLAIYIGQELNLGSVDLIDRAARLCKADLLSNMVYEFPELQGIMGRYYALHSGEKSEVAEAILEHYLPRFAGDRLPTTAIGIVLALAERIDNLTACFAIGIRPSGSQDPYALRRQALGVVNIILDLNLKIDLKKLIDQAFKGLTDIETEGSRDEISNELMDFIWQRLRGVMLERGFSHDVADAVLALPVSDLGDVQLRMRVIQEFKASDRYEDFMVVYNRTHNLTKKWDSTEVDPEVMIDESEKKLYQHYFEVKESVNDNIIKRDYPAALTTLTELRADIDQFFTAVMVMVEDEKLKAARLGMLRGIAELCNSVADFSKLN